MSPTNDNSRLLDVVLLDDVLYQLWELVDPGQRGDHHLSVLVLNIHLLDIVKVLKAVDGVLDLLLQVPLLYQEGVHLLLYVLEEGKIFGVRNARPLVDSNNSFFRQQPNSPRMFCDVFFTGMEMSPEVLGELRGIWTAITFVCLSRTTGDLSMCSADVIIKASSVFEVFITSLLDTIKTRLLLDSGVDLSWLKHEEAKVCPDRAMMGPTMPIP